MTVFSQSETFLIQDFCFLIPCLFSQIVSGLIAKGRDLGMRVAIPFRVSNHYMHVRKKTLTLRPVVNLDVVWEERKKRLDNRGGILSMLGGIHHILDHGLD